ncbi:flagellar basal-body MS-ring/collar protein FliF [Alterisphingorhabdus coralli]|uniref:Flagellar M-ring protein n=1 Tax=Alterisphingorhabdus coralli TaxID=3071408 RepID=A0AA97F782_9SPHN|nr:flagellar basal-body MS-ring/collar protein FliF [Parasphingorhabdus sp. SCSIO 66989]WOE74766.1 flagellar basal-body MS-ring/collar protein FliF [Parasphingorhabdus sp. SCSIO 66989]
MADPIITPGAGAGDSNSALAVQGAQRATPLIPKPAFGSGNLMDRIRALMAQPAFAKALPMMGVVAVLGLAAFAWLALREPPQRDLFRGLPDNDKAAVAAALQSSNIMYQIDSASGALTVSEEDYHTAKMTLAAQGLPRSAPDGDSVVSSLPMGASRAVEGEKLRTAREMDLARSIEAIDAVLSARVHLAVEPPSIFIRDRSAPAASVVLQLAPGGNLGEAQVRAITHLVASSVAGLNVENVSVVDQNGRLLSQDGAEGPMTEAERQLEVRERIEERYRRSLAALLTPMLGADNFVAEVSAEVDFTERQATSESFPADESRVRSEQLSWSAEPTPPTPRGIPGAVNAEPPGETELGEEIDPPAEEAEDAGELKKREEQINRNFELGRQVSVTRDAVGQVERISVAVAVRGPDGKPLPDEELAQIEALVKGAVGFDEKRGDQVAVSSRNFMDIATTETPWYEAGWVAMLVRNISALLVALALIFGIGRPLLRKAGLFKGKAKDGVTEEAAKADTKAEAAAPPSLGAMQTPQLGSNNDQGGTVTLDMITAAQSYQERALLIQNFVKQNPEHAAMVVRDLLRNDQEQANA